MCNFLLNTISDKPAINISEPPTPSRHPNCSFDIRAALIVPKIISESTKIEKRPAPIILGDHKIITFEGIKNKIDNIIKSGNIDIHELTLGNGPKASENITEVNKVTIKP